MYIRKSFLAVGILTALSASPSVAIAANETVFPAGVLTQSVVYQPAVFSEAPPSPSQTPEKATLQSPPSLSVKPTDENVNDRIFALGIVGLILALAFFWKRNRQTPAPLKTPRATDAHSPTESIATQALVAFNKPEHRQMELLAKEGSSPMPATGRSIVVPIDFSPNSALAIRLALIWAKPFDKLIVVYVCDLANAFPAENLTPSNLQDIHQAFATLDNETALHWSRLPWVMAVPLAMEVVQHWALNEFDSLSQALAVNKDTRVEFRVLQGEPVNRVLQFSEGISAKLIVLVAHRHSMMERWITGSHADTLVHASRIPVIVLCEPIQAELSLPQEILVTTDFSAESLPVFLVLKDLLQGARPDITVLTVETAYEHHPQASVILGALEKEFGLLGLRLRNVKIQASDVEAGILEYLQAHPAQLVAMSSHGRLGFAELIHPSVAKAILHDAGVPILVVHSKAMPITDTVDSLSNFLRLVTG